jgi:hypothetical protein
LEKGLRQGDPLSLFLFLLAVEGLKVMMNAVVDSNLYFRYSFGANADCSTSHLQFPDNTSLLREKSWANVHALRAVLLLFSSVSGIKVNFYKSILSGINIKDSWLAATTSTLNYKVGKLPLVYLGLPIGCDARRLFL